MTDRGGRLLVLACMTAVASGAGSVLAEASRVMTTHEATGRFDVTLRPVSPSDAAVSSMIFDKTFHGGLDAASVGQMLAVRNQANGSAGYVAMERVTGTLAGRHGSFALQRNGSMTREGQPPSVSIVPGSATGDLAGLSGTMRITVEDGRHEYGLRYSLPERDGMTGQRAGRP